MPDINIKYSTKTDFNVTLGSLASGAARQADSVSNSTNLFVDELVGGKITTGSTPSATGSIIVYAAGSIDGGILFSDGATGTDGSHTIGNNAPILGIISHDETASTTYEFGPWSVASAFGGILPQDWTIIVENQSGDALDSGANIVQEQKATAITTSNTASITASFASAPTEGNLLVACWSERSNNAAGTPSITGWTNAELQQADQPGVAIFYKVAGASESTDVTVSYSSGGDRQALEVFEYSGIVNTSPLEVSTSVASDGSLATSQTTGTTDATTQPDALAIAMVGIFDDPGTTGGWTNSFIEEDQIGDGNSTIRQAVATKILTSTGTQESTRSWTNSRDSAGAIVVFKADLGANNSIHHLGVEFTN